MYVKILADSLNSFGRRLTTFELKYHRFVHSELLTHRLFSRNSASSRAIPAAAMRKRVLDDPATPVYWGANQKGMQAAEELPDDDAGVRQVWSRPPPQFLDLNASTMGYPGGIPPGTLTEEPIPSSRQRAKDWWQRGLDLMAKHHEEGEALGLHKQIVNRVTEPWMHITVILTATEFGNWFKLRAHPEAQPEIAKLAFEMKDLYHASKPIPLVSGEWHLPLIYPEDRASAEIDTLCQVATGRCARVSYLTHDGKRDLAADVELCERLSTSGHWSPFEHPAQAMTLDEWNGWGEKIMRACRDKGVPFEPHMLGNLVGWKQYRKFFTDEHENLVYPDVSEV